MSKYTLIETANVERDYGFDGTRAIIDTAEHGRILIEDGFGGMDTLAGGCVRWRHGSAYKLRSTDTMESLDQDSDYADCGRPLSIMDAIIMQLDTDRPYIQHLSGPVVERIAKAVGI